MSTSIEKFLEYLKIAGNFHQAIYKEDLIDVVEDKNTILRKCSKKST